MSEQERAAIKIVLEGMVVKYQMEQLAQRTHGTSHASSLLPPHAQVSPWKGVNLSQGLLQHLDGSLDKAKGKSIAT